MFSERRWRRRGATLAILTAVARSLHAQAGRSSPFVPKRELKGLPAVYVEVDGLPNPVGEPGVSEVTIRDRIQSQLREAGLRILDPGDDPGAPIIRLTVLAPLRGGDYAYMINLYLEESCTLDREPRIELAWCRTWSIYPRIGFIEAGRESTLEEVASLAVGQFVSAWKHDNE